MPQCKRNVFDGWEDSVQCRQEAIVGFDCCLSCLSKDELMEALAAAREDVARMDKVQGHLAKLCSDRLDKILELERQLVNEKSAHAWTEVREQAAIDSARAGSGK